MSEYKDLDVALVLRSMCGSEKTTDEVIQEREQHGSPSERGMFEVPQGASACKAVGPSVTGK